MLPANDVFLFVDIVNLKSFSKAANKHAITPAAVSKRMTALEAAFSVKLLNRSTRKLTLTEAGEQLYKYSAHLSEALEGAIETALNAHQEPQGSLVVYAPTNFSNLVLAPILPEFLGQFNKISMRVVVDDGVNLPELGEYDVAIKNTQLADSNIIIKKILTVRMVACISPNYEKKYGILKKPQDLLNHNCLDYNHRNAFDTWTFKKANKTIDVAVKGNINTNSALLVKNLCLAGLGVAWLPNFMVEREFEQELLVPCLLGYESDDVNVYAAHPYLNKQVPQKVRVFIDFLTRKLQGTVI